jgi:hypothetical protein
LTVPRWEKTSIGVGQPSTSRWQEGIGEGEEDVKISDYRIWADTAKDEERMCKGKTVSEMSEWYYSFMFVQV